MPVLFAYGTLRDTHVQQATFGRPLAGSPDVLVGWAQGTVAVADARFVDADGRAEYAIVRRTGRDEDRVAGTALELTDDELRAADAYEPAEYARVAVVLASGRPAFVYADARDAASRAADGTRSA